VSGLLDAAGIVWCVGPTKDYLVVAGELPGGSGREISGERRRLQYRSTI
jgi:hypothetical protein